MAEQETQVETTTTATETSAAAPASDNGLPSAFNEAEDQYQAEIDKAAAQETGTEAKGGSTDDGEQNDDDAGNAGEKQATNPLDGLDESFVEGCRGMGIADEKIPALLESFPGLDKEVQALLSKNDDDDQPIRQTKADAAPAAKAPAEEPKIDELKFDLDPDIVGEDVKKAIDKIADVINARQKDMAEQKKALEQERVDAFTNRVNAHFDKVITKELPDVGMSANMTQKNLRLRMELLEHAGITARTRGIPLERALEIEAQKLKNIDGEKVAERKVLDKLKQQSKQLSNKPTRRAAEPARKFADESDRKEYRMRQAELQADNVE